MSRAPIDPMSPRRGEVGPAVLLFDGECGLCQRLVRLLLRLDARGRLRFASLQGTAAQGYLRAHGLPDKDFETLIFVPDWEAREAPHHLVRTRGLIAALRAIGGVARVGAVVLAVVPEAWRDAGYRWVARGRHRLFGPWQPGPLPRPEWKDRFLP